MANSKDDEIACVETVGTNAMEDISGVGGLGEFTELLKKCKIKSEDEITKDTDWRIAEWGYYDPTRRAAFLNGPTLKCRSGFLPHRLLCAANAEFQSFHVRQSVVANPRICRGGFVAEYDIIRTL